jgi:2-hydroxychromene-2-carboxylate isomerase
MLLRDLTFRTGARRRARALCWAGMPEPVVEFFGDPISPYAYIAWHRLRGLAARRPGLRVAARPVLLAAMLGQHGQLGPAEIEPKRVFTFKDVVRRCAEHGLQLVGPPNHPFNPLLALRAATAAADEQRAAAFGALLDAAWADGRDLADPAAVAAALTGAGLDGPALVAAAADPAVKQRLHAETAAAIARGVFGVPTFIVAGELVWGQDRLPDVEHILDGRDPVDPTLVAAMLARPVGAARR